MSSVSVHKSDDGTGLTWRWYARIDGKILCKSNGAISRFKSATSATIGVNREVERRRRLAVTMASQMPESSDFPSQNAGDGK